MLLTDARRAARTSSDCDLVPLAEQDRSLWDGRLVAEGVALVEATLSEGPVGPVQLQAAIAAALSGPRARTRAKTARTAPASAASPARCSQGGMR